MVVESLVLVIILPVSELSADIVTVVSE